MEEEQSDRIEKMEKAQEEMKGQLAQITELLKNLSKGKGVKEEVQEREQQTNIEDPIYPPGFGPNPSQTSQGGGHPFAYTTMPQMFGQALGQTLPSQGVRFADPIEVPNLDDPKEIEKLKVKQVEEKVEAKSQQKINMLEERLRVVEGLDFYGSLDATGLCLVSDLVIPPKFKAPEFEKYNGTSCPKSHLIMYCRKMAAYAQDDKLLIHIFQESLTGSAIKWYNSLDGTRITTWNDLAREFMAQYRHVTDMAPDRLSLQSMEKKANESFKQYAQRWRDVAAEVQPPLSEKELTIIFINTLKAPYYDRMIGNATKNFADMVLSGEIIENAVKSGKIEVASNVERKGGSNKRREEDVHAVTYKGPYGGYTSQHPYPMPQPYHPVQYPYQSYPSANAQPSFRPQTPMPTTQPATQPNKQEINLKGAWPKRERTLIDPIPITYTELYPQLIKGQLIAPIYVEPLKPPYPKWYDENARCEYHFGNVGHSLENCTALKYRVQGLIKAGLLSFEAKGEPTVNANPLLNHAKEG